MSAFCLKFQVDEMEYCNSKVMEFLTRGCSSDNNLRDLQVDICEKTIKATEFVDTEDDIIWKLVREKGSSPQVAGREFTSPSHGNKFNLSASLIVLQAPVPGLSPSSASPSFSYNIPNCDSLCFMQTPIVASFAIQPQVGVPYPSLLGIQPQAGVPYPSLLSMAEIKQDTSVFQSSPSNQDFDVNATVKPFFGLRRQDENPQMAGTTEDQWITLEGFWKIYDRYFSWYHH